MILVTMAGMQSSGFVPVDMLHAAHHQHGHINQRAGRGARRDHASQGGKEHRGDKQHAHGDGGEPGTSACSHPGAFP